jgi:hypothetical protein
VIVEVLAAAREAKKAAGLVGAPETPIDAA